jgi:hypothetical protein
MHQSLFPIYREANTFPYLMDEGIAGSPEAPSAEKLHKQALTIVMPYFQKAEKDAIDQYRQFAGTGHASNPAEEIVSVAYHGQVELLFVAVGIQQWGKFDPDTNAVGLHQEAQPGNEDLLNFAAIHTFLNG